MPGTPTPPIARPSGPEIFDHRDPGVSPRRWQPLLHALPELPWPAGSATLVILAAHPDDETLGCGTLIAHAAEAGHRVTVLLATDGEASHPRSSTHTPGMLAALRRRECASALSILAPGARLIRLGLPDGRLADHLGTLVEAIAAETGEAPVWLLSPWEGDRHPDHAACARAAQRVAGRHRACTLMEYPLWAWHWADPDGHELPVEAMSRTRQDPAAGRRRQRALGAYPSQHHPLSHRAGDEAILGPHVTAHFERDFDVLIDPRGSARRTAYFDALYRTSDDPWAMGRRWYEERKRAVLMASLPRRRFRRAFEPGCAGGHVTTMLARRCDELVAADSSAAAVELTARATAELPQVSVQQLHIPCQWAAGGFDLVVLSDIAYYIDDLATLGERLSSCLLPDGVVVLCHWRHPTLEHPLSARQVHRRLPRLAGIPRIARHREADFLLDVLSVDGISVARADGLVD